MQAPAVACPRCEALHPFRPQQRPITGERVEVYVRCTTCGHKVVLRESTQEIERLNLLKLRWEARGRIIKKKRGIVDSQTRSQIEKITARIKRLKDEISE